jgi:type IV pilus assembly protein PilW
MMQIKRRGISELKRNGQQGVSLVELMVSLVLGLVLVFGVTEIYVNSKSTYNVNEEMSRLQENARFIFDLMVPGETGIRMAGFTGCGAANFSSTPNDWRQNQTVLLSSLNSINGHESTGAATWSPALPAALAGLVVSNTDVISVQGANNCDGYLVGNMAIPNANVQINPTNTCGLAAGDPVMISDCLDTDIFTATNVSSGTAKITMAHSSSGNTQNFLSKAYQQDAEIRKPSSVTYYIRNGPSGIPALWRLDNFSGGSVELVEGVENMQITYGVDTDATADGIVDRYVTANQIPVGGNDWDRVITARLTLLLRSISGNALQNPATYTFNFEGATLNYGPDRILRQQYTTTVQLRNRNLLP